jgi:hypothetical protein
MVWSVDFGLEGPRFESRHGKEKMSIAFVSFHDEISICGMLRSLTREKLKTVPITIRLASVGLRLDA